jgi:hypothetical protein
LVASCGERGAIRWSAAAALLALALCAACNATEDFDITLQAHVDLDALMAGQPPISGDVIDTPGGLSLDIALSKAVDLVALHRSAAQTLLDGGRAEVRRIEVLGVDNSLTVDLPPLLLMVSDPEVSDASQARPVAQVDGIHVGALARPGQATWTAVGPARLAAALRALHFRVYLAGTLRLAKGDPAPHGAVDLQVVMRVRVCED